MYTVGKVGHDNFLSRIDDEPLVCSPAGSRVQPGRKTIPSRSASTEILEILGMALSRVPGREELYVGGIFALRRPSVLVEKNITHILSVLRYQLAGVDGLDGRYTHLSVDVDDMEDEDILVHLPQMVRFIERGLYGDAASFDGRSARNRAGRAAATAQDESTPCAVAAAAEDAPARSAADQLDRLRLDTAAAAESEPSPSPAPEDDRPPKPTGAVFVHCAMGKSRSVTAVVAWLLWKYPHRFGGASARRTETTSDGRAGRTGDANGSGVVPTSTARRIDAPGGGGREEPSEGSRAAVARAIAWVRSARGIAEPNPGFVQQLELWWDMGCPAGSDDAVRRHKRYKRWVYRREVEESARIGRAPDRLRFEDEEDEEDEDGDGEPSAAPTSSSPSSSSSSSPSSSTRTSAEPGLELRCKKCRRVLATKPFVVPHGGGGGGGRSTCPHVFVEPLSWMRPVLEEGALEGRLVCPNERCRASVGRYAWQGFQCSCGEWVCPAFSLQRGRVDEVVVAPARTTATRTGDRAADVRGGAQPQPGVVGAAEADRMAALGIRLPPGVGASGVGLARRGNL